MNICTNCKHSSSPGVSGLVFCQHPNLGINPVDGHVKSQFASAVRGVQLFGEPTCGPAGVWYEEIDPPTGAPKGWWSFIRGRK